MLHTLIVPAEAQQRRLDVWLEGALAGCTRSLVARLIKDGRCTVTPGKAKAGYFLRGGEQITIEVPELEPMEAVPEDIPLRVLHEDAAVVVIDKPAGMVVHPAVGHVRGTLVNALLGRYGQQLGGEPWRPGVVHRLDQYTSGVIVVARTAAALAFLQDAFRERRVTKRYFAALHGRLRSDYLEHDGWIGRHPRDFRKRAVLPAGTGDAKEAQTSFRVVGRHDAYTLVEARPRTGRTHQIRVHAAALGHPVIADGVYGRSDRWPVSAADDAPVLLRRQALHAWGIDIPHPDGRRLRIVAEIPEDLRPLVTGAMPTMLW